MRLNRARELSHISPTPARLHIVMGLLCGVRDDRKRAALTRTLIPPAFILFYFVKISFSQMNTTDEVKECYALLAHFVATLSFTCRDDDDPSRNNTNSCTMDAPNVSVCTVDRISAAHRISINIEY